MLNVKEAGALKSIIVFKTLSNLLDFHITQHMLTTTFLSLCRNINLHVTSLTVALAAKLKSCAPL